MELGEIIAELRQDKGLNQKELGKLIHRSGSTISNYENNTFLPDLETLDKMADYFGVSADYIMRRTKYKFSLEQLNATLGNDITIGDLLNTLVEMDSESRNHFLHYFNLIKKSSGSVQKIYPATKITK